MTGVAVDRVSKVFPGGVRAVDEVTLDVEDREFLALLGPSGCGKTTLLRLIAGLETPTSGAIRIGDRVVNDTAPKDRDVAMVFQNYALYPHWSVADNITLGMRTRRLAKTRIAQRLADAARVLNLSELLRRLPRQLSGGQQQRVALGRAMVREPKVFLLDEPLSNLDARLRLHMRTELIKLHRRMETTTIYVTHDQGEAMAMATRVAVMRDGAIEQIGPPMEVYRNPVNRYVAGFMGNPEMNFLPGTVTKGAEGFALSCPGFEIQMPDARDAALAARLEEEVVVGIRPEELAVRPGGPLTVAVDAVVDIVEPMGSRLLAYANVANASVVADLDASEQPKPGENVRFWVDPARVHAFDTTTGVALW
jgi:multiple sugar transport system ATP-binding protein